ncbi:MAG: ComF family protein [Kiritimatiellae bacterium]|nr:ComF family protein [Kiritimatiellia bacterium]
MGILSGLLDLVFPRACAACGAPPDEGGRHVCWDCLASVPLVTAPYCRVCGDPVSGAISHDYVCAACTDRPPSFDMARSAARYAGCMQKLLQAFKYEGATWLRTDLGTLLCACIEAHYPIERIDAVVHVPLHPAKERERCYNQAHLLARVAARRLGKPLLPRCLRRTRATPSQTKLAASARRRNVRQAFRAGQHGWVDGRNLLLIDDVMTTGATVNECAKTLKAAGAARVYVATVARG